MKTMQGDNSLNEMAINRDKWKESVGGEFEKIVSHIGAIIYNYLDETVSNEGTRNDWAREIATFIRNSSRDDIKEGNSIDYRRKAVKEEYTQKKYDDENVIRTIIKKKIKRYDGYKNKAILDRTVRSVIRTLPTVIELIAKNVNIKNPKRGMIGGFQKEGELLEFSKDLATTGKYIVESVDSIHSGDVDIIRELNYIMDAIMTFSYRRNAKDMTGVKVNFDKHMRDLKRGLETVRKIDLGSDFFKREIIRETIKDSEFDDKQRTDWAFAQLAPLNGMTDTNTIMKATDEFINLLPEITELMTTGTEEDIQKFCDKVSRERS